MAINLKVVPRSSAGQRGKAIKISLAGVLVAAALGGCNLSDADLSAMRYCGLGTRTYNAAMCSGARKTQASQRVDRSWAARQRQLNRSNPPRTPRPILTPAQRLQQKQQAKKQKALAAVEAKRQKARLVAKWKRTTDKWNQLHQSARRRHAAMSQKYPRIGWLGGTWCYTPKKETYLDKPFTRLYEFLDDGRLRRVNFEVAKNGRPDMGETLHLARPRDGLYILTFAGTWTRPIPDPFARRQYYETAIRKENQNQFSEIWRRTVTRNGPQRKKSMGRILKRCAVG